MADSLLSTSLMTKKGLTLHKSSALEHPTDRQERRLKKEKRLPDGERASA